MLDSSSIRAKALEAGFNACGFARAEALSKENDLNSWLENSFHGEMHYMERNKDLRLDPRLLFPGAKTVIPLLASYFCEDYLPDSSMKISRYAIGRDYHKVLKKRGQNLIRWMQEKEPGVKARIYVDSAPIMEKEWGRLAGLGWIGKNTCLIRPGEGSWFFLGVILTDFEIEPDQAENRNLCGNCTKCIDTCPTGAIHPDGFLDATKCLSYLTIEKKGSIPEEFKGQTDNWIFGCDVCQEVCPHNRFALESSIPDLRPKEIFNLLTPQIINDMEEEAFQKNFAGSALKRAGLEKLKQSVTFLSHDD